MLVYIFAYEGSYGGLHGMYEEDIQSYQYSIYENSYYEEISETEYLEHEGE